jgi:hypothetical protein
MKGEDEAAAVSSSDRARQDALEDEELLPGL